MRLPEGIVVDAGKTFGVLKFSALRREVFLTNEDGTVSTNLKERTYDLKSKAQGMMIQVSIPADVPLKEFTYNAEVELVDLRIDTVATANWNNATVTWYMKAKDMVLKPGGAGGNAPAGAASSNGAADASKDVKDGRTDQAKKNG